MRVYAHTARERERDVPERRHIIRGEVKALRHRRLRLLRLLLESAEVEVAVLLVPSVERLLVHVPVRRVVFAVAEGLGLDAVPVLDVVGRLGRLDGRVLGLGVRLRRLLLDLLWGCMGLCWWYEMLHDLIV